MPRRWPLNSRVMRLSPVAGAFAASSDQILDVVEAAILKHIRFMLLGVCRVQNLADIRSDQGFSALAVNVRDSLAEVGSSKLSCSRVELRAHLLDGSSVATDDEHVLPDKHDHSSLASRKRRERLRIHDVQIGLALRAGQSGSHMILQVILPVQAVSLQLAGWGRVGWRRSWPPTVITTSLPKYWLMA